MTIIITARAEYWDTAQPFVISRGTKNGVEVIVCTISDGRYSGQGEATPIYYEGETAESCIAQISAFAADHPRSNRQALGKMPAGAARNALDCALWDLESHRRGLPLWQVAGLPAPRPLRTAYTISLGDSAAMAAEARRVATYPLLKLKLCGKGDRERVAAVRRAAPLARLIADANESWDDLDITAEASALAAFGVEMIEQPISAGREYLLEGVASPIPFCADESCHTAADVQQIAPYFQAVNIKLDKAGGLSEAIAMAGSAQTLDLDIMVGCMLCTSMAIAPAFALAQRARWVDLDGPLLLARDRTDGFHFANGTIFPAA